MHSISEYDAFSLSDMECSAPICALVLSASVPKIGEAPPSVTNLLPASARSHGCIFDRYFDGIARASAKPLIFLVTPTGIEPVFQP